MPYTVPSSWSVGTRAGVHLEVHHLGEAPVFSHLQRAATRKLAPRIHIGAGRDQDLNDVGAALATMFAPVGADHQVPDYLVEGGVQILTTPGNPITESVHIRTGGKKGFDGTQVAAIGGVEQLVVNDVRMVTETGRSDKDEHENNGAKTHHGIASPPPDGVFDRPGTPRLTARRCLRKRTSLTSVRDSLPPDARVAELAIGSPAHAP